MLRTILGFPFVLIGYILMIPGSLFAWLACKIRGKDYPGLTTSK